MGVQDQDYFAARADEERQYGDAATSPQAAAAHFEMAFRYGLLASRAPEPRSILHIVTA